MGRCQGTPGMDGRAWEGCPAAHLGRGADVGKRIEPGWQFEIILIHHPSRRRAQRSRAQRRLVDRSSDYRSAPERRATGLVVRGRDEQCVAVALGKVEHRADRVVVGEHLRGEA